MTIQSAIELSICIVTYNQSSYLDELLKSILDQSFESLFEVIIGDDASTDKTELVVEKYKELGLPIRYFKRPQNIGPTQNYILTHTEAKGDFVSHLDGDDKCLCEKFNKSIAILKASNSISAVWHQVRVFNDQNHTLGYMFKSYPDEISLNQVSLYNLLQHGTLGAHSSLTYRRSALDFKEFILKTEHLDYYFAIQLLKNGNGYIIPDILGEYRLNVSGSTMSKSTGRLFKRSKVREIYCHHLKTELGLNPNFRLPIVLNAVSCSIRDLIKRRTSSFHFIKLVLANIRPRDLAKIPNHLRQNFKLHF